MPIAVSDATARNAATRRPNSGGVGKRAGKELDIDKDGPIMFWNKLKVLAKTPVEKREISHFQLWSPVFTVIAGAMSLVALMVSNYLRDPSSKGVDPDTTKGKLLLAIGKAFQPLFELITINNFLTAAFRITPARLLTYGGLTLYNPFAWHDEWSMIDNVQKVKILEQEKQLKKTILQSPGLEQEQRVQLKREINELQDQINELNNKAAALHSRIGFFGRVVYNIIMSCSFLYLLPEISRSARYGKLKPGEEVGPYTGRIPSGFRWKHFIEGYKGKNEKFVTGSYWNELKRRFKQEFVDCPKMVLKEFFQNLRNPQKAQGTIWGKNPTVEKEFDRAIKAGEIKDNVFNRWRVRLSGGLLPSLLNVFNVFARAGIIASSAIAAGQYGMKVFNRGSPYTDETDYQAFIEDKSNPVGKAAVDTSNSLIWNGRMLSGISGLLIAFNPGFVKYSGIAAAYCQGAGSTASIFSALAGGSSKMSTVDIFLQFTSSILLFLAGGLSNLNAGIKKDANIELFRKELIR